MDFLDPKKKRNHNIRLIVGYILIAIIIGLGTLILIFQSYGYDLDRKTGSIIQNGLVFVSAQPEQASIYLNNKLYKTNDSGRFVLPSNVYKLELKRDGYRTWQRTFSLAGGTIERFVYPFLFPETLTTTDRQLYATTPGFASQSPDRRWIVVQQPGSASAFEVFDANDPALPPVTITLPDGLLTASPQHSFEYIEWSTDNRHLLVKHSYQGAYEFIVIDREDPAASLNINRTFNRNPTEVTLRNKNYDRYYFFEQAVKKLETADIKSGQAGIKTVLNNVIDYKTHGNDMIIYATAIADDAKQVQIMLKDNDGSYAVRKMPVGTSYLLDLAQFDSKWYVVMGVDSDNRIYVYKNPLDVLKRHDSKTPLVPATVLRVDTPSQVSFSANARFIMGQGGSTFGVYDAENDRSFRYDINKPLDGDGKAYWMDGHRMYVTSQNKLVVFDYDGINIQTLTNNTPGYRAFFDRDYKMLYNIAPSTGVSGRAALTQTELEIDYLK